MSILLLLIPLLTLCVLTDSIASSSASSMPLKLHFNLPENQDKGIIVGNIRNELRKLGNSNVRGTESIEVVGEDSIRNSVFQISLLSGDILTTRLVDREEICPSSDSDSAVVEDSPGVSANKGSPSGTTPRPGNEQDTCQVSCIVALGNVFVEVIVRVLDENDNPPVFQETSTRLELPETTQVGSSFQLPTAKDIDSQRFGLREYRLTSKASSESADQDPLENYFELHQDTTSGHLVPNLRLVRQLDWETKARLVGILEAVDRGGLVGRLQVTVEVTDVNEHAPVWRHEPYTRSLRECTQEKEVFTLLAEDKDNPSTDNGQVHYQLATHSTDFATVNALFYVTGRTLNVQTHKLAQSKKTSFQFFLTAQDGRGLSSDTLVKIDVEDCNNHKPSIDVKNRSLAVWENDWGVRLLTYVHVRDEDRGLNSDFHCGLSENTRLQLVEATSNAHLLSTANKNHVSKWAIYRLETKNESVFDREVEKKSQVLIRCMDSGTPPQSNQLTLPIRIADKNDNRPHFLREPYHFTVAENMAHGTLIGTLVATDNDVGKNSVVEFSLEAPSNLFSVGMTGEIRTLQVFDRERQNSFEFKVVVRDQGEPPLKSTAVVKVSILDVNDNMPVMEQNLAFSITEAQGSTVIHHYFGRLNATDLDLGENGTVLFKLGRVLAAGSGSVSSSSSSSSSNPPVPREDLFGVSHDGQLHVYGNLDRERVSAYFLDVIAYDRGNPVLSSLATATVQILDLNDNQPKFHIPLKLQQAGGILNVSADTPSGAVLHQFEAIDPDLSENGSVSFHLMQPLSHLMNELFLLSEDGKLILQRESTAIQFFDRVAGSGLHTLVLKATDHGPEEAALSSYFTLKIRFIPASEGSSDALMKGTGEGSSYRTGMEPGLIYYYYLAALVVALLLIALLSTLLFFYLKGRCWPYGDSRGRYGAPSCDNSEVGAEKLDLMTQPSCLLWNSRNVCALPTPHRGLQSGISRSMLQSDSSGASLNYLTATGRASADLLAHKARTLRQMRSSFDSEVEGPSSEGDPGGQYFTLQSPANNGYQNLRLVLGPSSGSSDMASLQRSANLLYTRAPACATLTKSGRVHASDSGADPGLQHSLDRLSCESPVSEQHPQYGDSSGPTSGCSKTGDTTARRPLAVFSSAISSTLAAEEEAAFPKCLNIMHSLQPPTGSSPGDNNLLDSPMKSRKPQSCSYHVSTSLV